MEHLRAIKAAITAKAPIVAIPIEGHAPVCIRQKLLKGALRGVEVQSIEVISLSDRRSVKISGRAGSVKTSCTIYAIDRRTASQELSKWSAKERTKAEKRILLGALSAAEVRASRLAAIERENLAEENRPVLDAQRTIANIKADVLPVVVPINNRAETAQRFSDHRSSRRLRSRESAMRHQLRGIKKEIDSLTSRRVPTGKMRRLEVVYKTVTKKFLKAPDAGRLISLVADAISLGHKIEAIQLPAYHWMKPKIERNTDYRNEHRAAPLSPAWYEDRLARARHLAHARRILAAAFIPTKADTSDSGDTHIAGSMGERVKSIQRFGPSALNSVSPPVRMAA